jgi:hypothetical protein
LSLHLRGFRDVISQVEIVIVVHPFEEMRVAELDDDLSSSLGGRNLVHRISEIPLEQFRSLDIRGSTITQGFPVNAIAGGELRKDFSLPLRRPDRLPVELRRCPNLTCGTIQARAEFSVASH